MNNNFNDKNVIFIHDYETFGLNPNDKVSQFAGIFVDLDFNIIEEPHMFFCKTPDDCVPSPIACAITGISPKDTEDGLTEYAFAKRIHDLMNRSNVINAGYNNASFDDEVSRNLFYRNFLPVYTREFKNGNSRFDFYKLVKAVYAFKPELINFPKDENGKNSLKLENLSKANGIEHTSAHDALSDVYATIGIGKLIKEKDSNLYNWVMNLRFKKEAINFIKQNDEKMIWCVDNFEKAEYNFLSPALLIHSKEKMSEFYFIDLYSDKIDMLTDKSIEELKDWMSKSYNQRDEEGLGKFPIIKVKANKMPVLAPAKVLSADKVEERGMSTEVINENYKKAMMLKRNPEFLRKIAEIVEIEYPPKSDPDELIYGGFPTNSDNSHIQSFERNINNLGIKQVASTYDYNKSVFDDDKYDILAERMLVRNAFNEAPEQIKNRWNYYCKSLIEGPNHISLDIDGFYEELAEAQEQYPDKKDVLNSLEGYMVEKCNKLNVKVPSEKVKKNSMKP